MAVPPRLDPWGRLDGKYGFPSTPTTNRSDGYVRIWDAASGTQLQVLTGFTGPTLAVAFSRDGTSLAASSRDHTIKLCQISSDGSPLTLTLTLYGHTGSMNGLAFNAVPACGCLPGTINADQDATPTC